MMSVVTLLHFSTLTLLILLSPCCCSCCCQQVGATFNHAYIMGYVNRAAGYPPVLPSTPMAAYDGGWGAVLPFEKWPNYQQAKANVPAIRTLLQASDFLGVSNYAR